MPVGLLRWPRYHRQLPRARARLPEFARSCLFGASGVGALLHTPEPLASAETTRRNGVGTPCNVGRGGRCRARDAVRRAWGCFAGRGPRVGFFRSRSAKQPYGRGPGREKTDDVEGRRVCANASARLARHAGQGRPRYLDMQPFGQRPWRQLFGRGGPPRVQKRATSRVWPAEQPNGRCVQTRRLIYHGTRDRVGAAISRPTVFHPLALVITFQVAASERSSPLG